SARFDRRRVLPGGMAGSSWACSTAPTMPTRTWACYPVARAARSGEKPMRSWNPKSKTSNRRAGAVLLRGLGVVYLSAFGSLAVQLDGLFGSRGISPVAEYLDRAGQVLGKGPGTYWQLPTLLWIDASDRALHGLCWGAVGLSVLLIAGFWSGPCLALLWLSYLSLTVVW